MQATLKNFLFKTSKIDLNVSKVSDYLIKISNFPIFLDIKN